MPKPRHVNKAEAAQKTAPVAPPPEATSTFDPATAHLYGGDFGVLRTMPERHPTLDIPVPRTRAEMKNPQLNSMYLQGDLVFKPNPSAKMQITEWNDDGSETSFRHYRTLRSIKGYEEANPEEWFVADYLRQEIVERDGRLVRLLGRIGGSDRYAVLMVRSGERLLDEIAEKEARATGRVERTRDENLANVLAGSGISMIPTEVSVEEFVAEAADDND